MILPIAVVIIATMNDYRNCFTRGKRERVCGEAYASYHSEIGKYPTGRIWLPSTFSYRDDCVRAVFGD